jgi:hypothetical protein
VDIVAYKGNLLTMFEVKHLWNIDREYYARAVNTLLGAQEQLKEYFEVFARYLSSQYTVTLPGIKGQKSYELFKIDNNRFYINLRTQPLGVIEYWFSSSNKLGQPQPENQLAPQEVKRAYLVFAKHQEARELIFEAIDAYSTSMWVIAGTVAAGAVVGTAVYVAGPEIAAWVASGASTVTISLSETIEKASDIIYQAGQKIDSFISAPVIPEIFAK